MTLINKKLFFFPQSQPGQSEFKWFLFNIAEDFSDIFVKTSQRYLSHKVIMEAIKRAKLLNKAVPILLNSESHIKKWPRIYALPSAPLKFREQKTMTDNFLIFGPYLRHSNSNLLLMQNNQGQLMLRDEYERKYDIKNQTRTRCLWIYANSLKCVKDADPRPMKVIWNKDGSCCAIALLSAK